MVRPGAASSLACMLVVLSVGLAAAEESMDLPRPAPDDLDERIAAGSEPEAASADWRTREQLLGDLGGLRPWLATYGMTLELVSYDEAFAVPDAELDADSGRRYHGLTDLVLGLDTEAAGWWRGGQLVVMLQNTRGGDISDVVGDAQGTSNIVAPPGTRFAEYYLEQELAGGSVRLKLGKQDANADFVVSHGGGEFINSSFGLIPTVPLPTYPAPALGAMGFWQVSERVGLKAGIWDGAPALTSGCLSTVFDASGGAITAVGAELEAFGGDLLSGTYRVGVWRHSEVELFAAPAKAAAEPRSGPAEGVYFTADQGLWEGEVRRLDFFAQGGWAEGDRSAFSRYAGGGLTLAAPFASRPADLVGLGVAWAEIGDLGRVADDCGSETVVELFYKLALTPWMTLIPDLQWVDRPSGLDGTTFVAGLRVATVF